MLWRKTEQEEPRAARGVFGVLSNGQRRPHMVRWRGREPRSRKLLRSRLRLSCDEKESDVGGSHHRGDMLCTCSRYIPGLDSEAK